MWSNTQSAPRTVYHSRGCCSSTAPSFPRELTQVVPGGSSFQYSTYPSLPPSQTANSPYHYTYYPPTPSFPRQFSELDEAKAQQPYFAPYMTPQEALNCYNAVPYVAKNHVPASPPQPEKEKRNALKPLCEMCAWFAAMICCGFCQANCAAASFLLDGCYKDNFVPLHYQEDKRKLLERNYRQGKRN